MLASSPTVTSPIKTAVGAIKALGEMFGLFPLYSMIIQNRPPLNVCMTIFDGRRESKIASCGASFQQTFKAAQ
jgi:hypothetical protein